MKKVNSETWSIRIVAVYNLNKEEMGFGGVGGH